MWEPQSGKFTTSKKVNVDFWLPEFSAKTIVAHKFHVDESTKGRYGMILGIDLLIILVLDIDFYDNFIIGIEGPYEGYLEPMVDLSNYNFIPITYN